MILLLWVSRTREGNIVLRMKRRAALVRLLFEPTLP